MARMRQKLHSRRGASILLALVLFLVASTVISVILSASLTAARRLEDDRAREQEYIAVSSAAKFFAKALERASYSITTTTPLDEDKNPLPGAVTVTASALRGLDGILAAADSGEKTITVTLRLPGDVTTNLG
jgi:type II secretory pathway component PulK